MPTYQTVLTPSLHPSSVISISIPSSSTSIGKDSIVKEWILDGSSSAAVQDGDAEAERKERYEEVGEVKRLAVRGDMIAIADSNHVVSTFNLPADLLGSSRQNGAEKSRGDNTDEQDDDDGEEPDDEESDDPTPSPKPSPAAEQLQLPTALPLTSQYRIPGSSASREGKGKRKRDLGNFVGFEVLGDRGIISILSSGLLTLTPFPSSSTQSTQSTTLPSNLTCSRLIPSSNPTHLALAGKEVDVSLWDVELLLADGARKDGEGKSGEEGKKRKKGELERGEVWRARNLPNNHLNLRTPIHHLSLCILPTSSSSTSISDTPTQPNDVIGSTSIVTGTKSGHVRRYDTRQRKCVSDWKVAREGGVGVVRPGINENELFFADTSSLLGSLDLRTGRVLYTYPSQTCTPLHLLPLPTIASASSTSALVTVSSDATLRACSTTAPPKEAKGNVRRGEILGAVGGVGRGHLIYYGVTMQDGEDDDGEREGEEVEEVWDEMSVVDEEGVDGSDDADGVEDSDEEDESEVPKRKRGKNGSGKQ